MSMAIKNGSNFNKKKVVKNKTNKTNTQILINLISQKISVNK